MVRRGIICGSVVDIFDLELVIWRIYPADVVCTKFLWRVEIVTPLIM